MKRAIQFCVFSLISIQCFSQYAFESKKEEKVYRQMEDYYSDGDYESILNKEDDYLKLFEDKQDTLSALVYSFLGEAYLYWDGDLEKSLEFYQKEYDLRKSLQDVEGNDMKSVIFNLGYLNDELGYYNKTEDLYKELLLLDEVTFGRNSEEYYLTAYALVDHYIYTENPVEGIALIKDLERVVERNSFEDAMVAKAYGDLLQITGSFKKAETVLAKSLEILESLGLYASIEYVRVLNSLGGLNVSMGKFPEAEEIYLEALDIFQRLEGDYSEDYYAMRGNLARVYTALGNFNKAEQIYVENISFDKEQYGEDSFFYGLDIYNHALNYLNAGKYDESEKYHQIAGEIFKAELGEESAFYGRILNNLAILNFKRNRWETATDFGMQAIENWSVSVGQEHEFTSYAYFNLGNAFLLGKQVAKGEEQHLESLRIRKKILGKDHPVYAKSTQKLAVINWLKNNPKEALKYYDETFENYFNQINQVFPILSEEEKTKFYYNNLKPTFEQYNAFIVKSSIEDKSLIGKMYDYQLAIKGLIFYATNKVRDAILNSGDTTLISQYEGWVEMKEQMAKLLSATDLSASVRTQRIDSLAELTNSLEKQLSSASGAFSETFVQKKLTWRDVQKQLKPGEAAVEIIRFRDFTPASAGVFTDEVYYAALVVNSETKDHPEMVIMRNGRLLETRFLSNYRNAIHYKVEENETYRMYWRPIANKLEGIKKVYFSPDGAFNQISLYTLKNPETEKFIIDELEIRLLTNTKDLLAVNTHNGEPGSQLLVWIS